MIGSMRPKNKFAIHYKMLTRNRWSPSRCQPRFPHFPACLHHRQKHCWRPAEPCTKASSLFGGCSRNSEVLSKRESQDTKCCCLVHGVGLSSLYIKRNELIWPSDADMTVHTGVCRLLGQTEVSPHVKKT